MSDFKYQVGDVVRFVEPGYNHKQQAGMTAVVRELSSIGLPIVDTDDEGEILGWGAAVEFVSRPSDLPSQIEQPTVQLTVRDQFAMAALTGLLANPEPTPTFNKMEDVQSHYARIAFGYADAMKEARK